MRIKSVSSVYNKLSRRCRRHPGNGTRTFRSRALSLPGAKVPNMQGSESLVGTFAFGSESARELSLPGLFARRSSAVMSSDNLE